MNNETGTDAVLRFASEDFTVFEKVLDKTKRLSGNVGDEEATSVCAPTIVYLRNIYKQYVLEDYKAYCAIASTSHTLYEGDGKESIIKRRDFVNSNWKQQKPPKEKAPLPICSTRAVFISIDANKALIKSWG